MLTDLDRRVLQTMSKQLLLNKSEIAMKSGLNGTDGVDVTISRLKDLGFVEKVESLGTCFVITQRGLRALKGFVDL